jgi:hypothetical protein
MTHLADLLRERKESLDVSAAHLRHGCLETRCFTAHAPLALHACKERRPAARRARDAAYANVDLFRGQRWLQAGKPWSRPSQPRIGGAHERAPADHVHARALVHRGATRARTLGGGPACDGRARERPPWCTKTRLLAWIFSNPWEGREQQHLLHGATERPPRRAPVFVPSGTPT